MKPSRCVNLLVAFLFAALLFETPRPVAAGPASLQAAGGITGDGKVCNSRGQCGSFSLTFDPGGGPVTGSVNVTWPITDVSSNAKIGEETLQGTLSGNFEGGDGGQVSGTMASGQWSAKYTVKCATCINDTKDVAGTPWLGNLRADGTGNGYLGPVEIVWNITYSAEDFRAGMGGKKGAAKTPTKNGQITSLPPSTLAGQTITATGQFCDSQQGFCGPFTISFNPAGGPVTGTFSARFTPPNDDTILKVDGTLEGAFTGGDGGQVGGTIPDGVWDWTCPSCGFVYATPASLAGYGWKGTLSANGTGSGEFYPGATWQVTFSGADFQTGLTGKPKTDVTETPASQDYIQEQIGGLSVEQGDKAWTEHELQMLHEVLDQLPPGLRNKLALEHIARYTGKLNIKTGTLKDNVMGDYSPADQADCPTCARTGHTIRIFDPAAKSSYFQDPSGDTDFKATILHEMIHALQYYKDDQGIYKNPDTDNPLMKTYVVVSGKGSDGWTYKNKQWVYLDVSGNNPPTDYGKTNPMEDMSESVKMYVYDPKLLQTSSPDRYTYIRDNLFGGIEYENGKQKGK
jgi:hypothetical protein